jgi:lysozyme
MKINERGKALIREFEGLRLQSYRDAVGIATIGYGSTGPHVRIPMEITVEEAEALLTKDLSRFETGVSAMLTGTPTSEDEFAAIVSLAFNVGLQNVATSTLLKRHKAGNKIGAANAFLSWVFAGGRKLNGLIRRREAERALYLGEDA